jgi:hypothetical protein
LRPDFFDERTTLHALGTWEDLLILLLQRSLPRLPHIGAADSNPLAEAEGYHVRSTLHLRALHLLFKRSQWADETRLYLQKMQMIDKIKSMRLSSSCAPALCCCCAPTLTRS